MPSDVLITPATSKIDFTDASNSTKKLSISGTTFSFNSNLNVLSTTSLSSAFKAEGVNGTLFEVTDDLSNSLMSVNTIGGLPVFEVFANNSIIAGQYNANDFVISGNKIGLGYANPVNKLSISGSVSIGASYNVAAPSNGLIVQGNVGIGTITPSAKLTIVDNTDGGRINLVGRTSDDTAAINFRATGDASTYAYISPDTLEFRLYHNDGFMSFYPGGTEKWRITAAGVLQSNNTQTIQTSTGNLTLATAAGNGHVLLSPHGTGKVGIGTASPAVKLDVNGSINTSSFMYVSYPYGNAYPFQIVANNFLKADNYYYGMLIRSGDVNYISGKFQINGGSNKRVEISGYEETVGYLPVVIPGGNVGIGTTSPAAKLVVVAGGDISGINLSYDSSTNNRTGLFAWTRGSSLAAIGGGVDYTAASTFTARSTAASYVEFGSGATRFYGNTSLTSGNGFTPTERMCISTIGNVGIGTTAPASNLEVRGATDLGLASVGLQTQLWVSDNTNQTTGVGGGISFAGKYITSNATQITFGAIRGSKVNTTSADTLGHLELYAFGGDFKFHSQTNQLIGANAVLMTIKANGNVGVGTPIPTARLDVRPTTATAYQGTVPYQTTTAAILSPVMAAASVDTYTSILQLVSVRQALVAGRYAHGYLGFSTVDNSNINGILDAGRISIKNDDGVGLHSATAMGFWTNPGGSASTAAIERVRIASDGNVGIGNTNPEYKLDFGALNTTASIDTIRFNSYNGPSGGGGGVGAATGGGTTIGGGIIWKSNYAGYTKRSAGVMQIAEGNYFRAGLAFYTNNVTDQVTDWTEAMRISSNSYVGIGTVSPTQKLQVQGNIYATDGALFNFKAQRIPLEGAPQQGVYKGYLILAKAYTSGLVEASYVVGKVILRRGTSGTGHNLDIYEVNSSRGYDTEIFQVSRSGAIGARFLRLVKVTYGGVIYHAIETSNGGGQPSTEMYFEGSIVDSPLIFTDESFVSSISAFGVTTIFVDESSNVGIGTVSPAAKLEIAGFSTGAGLKLNYGNSSGTIEAVNFIANGAANGVIGMQMVSAGVGDLWLGGSGGRTLTLYRDGNVGIGVTAPANKLAVSGSASIGSSYNVAAPANGLIVEGSVGIGITSPTAKLHVVGSSILANQTTINPDSYTGVVAGNIADGSGWGVTGIGLNGGAAGRTLGIGNSGTDFYFGASNGSSATSLQTYIQFNGPNRHVYLVPASGNVGIGTVTPASKLHLNSTTSGAILLKADGTNGTLFSVSDDLSNSLMSVNTIGGLPVFEVFANNSIIAGQYGQNDFVISGNKVGIGTASPAYKLDVNGTGNFSGTLIVNGISINQERAANARMYGATTGSMGLLGVDSAGAFRWQIYGDGSSYGFLDSTWNNWDLKKNINSELDLRVGGVLVRVLNAGNYTNYAVDNSKRIKTFVWDSLGAVATQARRYEIARIGIDIVNWNAVGMMEIDLSENYYSKGLKKKYSIWYGYTNPRSGLVLTEMSGMGTNNFQVVIGAETQVSGNQYYLPIYVEAREYTSVAVRMTMGRLITTNSSPEVGYTYIIAAPTGTNIADFGADSVVNISNAATGWQVGGNVVLHAGNVATYALPIGGGTLTGTITATNFIGPGTSLTGTASSLVAGSADAIADGVVSTSAKIANSVVTLAKIANISTGTFLGNNAVSAGPPIALTMAQAASMLSGQTFNTAGTAAGLSATLAVTSGGTGGTTQAAGRTGLGATTLGANLFTLADVSAVDHFIRVNANNTVDRLNAADFRTAIGAGTGGGSGTVTSVSVVSANGFNGSVNNNTTTPAITLTTTITGILKGNSTAISAATAGTDYLAPNTNITVNQLTATQAIIQKKVQPAVNVSGNVAVTIDVSSANVHVLTLDNGAVINSLAYTNRAADGAVNTILLVIKYLGTSASITWSNVIWANGNDPTLTKVNGYADVYALTSYKGASGYWIGTVVAQNLISTNL